MMDDSSFDQSSGRRGDFDRFLSPGNDSVRKIKVVNNGAAQKLGDWNGVVAVLQVASGLLCLVLLSISSFFDRISAQ